MGRPPIGKEAMSAAERQRRHRAQLRDSRPVTKPAKPDGRVADAAERQWRAMWQAEGRSLADYKAGLEDQESEVWQWRRAKGVEAVAAERAAWLRDHPGNPLPEHLCSLTEAEGAEYDAWRVQAADAQAENTALKAEIARLKREAEPRTTRIVTVEAVRDLVKRYGYRLRKHGAEYHLIDADGELSGGGTLAGIAGYFDMLETAKATGQRIQISTACDTPLYSFDPATASGGTAGEIAALKKELAQAKTRIAELVKARKPVPADHDSELARAKATIVDLRARLRYFQKRPNGKVDERTFTIQRSRTHPDRVSDPEEKARYKIAFEVLGELENVFVDHEQSRLVREDFDAKFKERDAKLRARAKKRQSAASPKPRRGLPRS